MRLSPLLQRLRRGHPDALICVLEAGVPGVTDVLGAVRVALPDLRRAKGSILLLGAPSATLAQLSRSLAAELGPEGIRANALTLLDASDEDAAIDAGQFLLSAEASYVTGITLPIGPRPGAPR